MADLVLQDEVDVVTVQVGVLGKDLLGPCGVLLQRFGILGGGYAGHQCVGQIKQLLLQAAGQNGQTMTSMRPMFSFLMWWSLAWGW